MINEYKTILEKLDGKQSVAIPIDIKQNGQYVEDPLDIIIKGFLKFTDIEVESEIEAQTNSANFLEDKTVIYPVLFSTENIRINNGRAVIVLLPRSEDLFEETITVQQRIDEDVVSNESIISQGGAKEDELITDSEKEPVVIKIETGVIRKPYKLSIEVTVTSPDATSVYSKTVDRGSNPQIEINSDVKSLFNKETKRSPSNFIVGAYSNLEWVPSVNAILNNNDSSQNTILSEINNLKNSTPLGTSTMYDAVIAGARILSDGSVDNSKKTMYVFTDNEANISIASLNDAITEVNDIDGDKQVPVLIGNMAVSDNITLSIKANRSDTKEINEMSFLTGGQSVTVVDESYLDDIVGIFYRQAVGSMGYGTYEFIKDFGEEISVDRITSIFDIPDNNSNASWEIETSLDGYNYTAINKTYNYNEDVSFEDLLARYIKFKITLITAIISSPIDEYGTSPPTPSLTYIEVVFNANNVAYLYLNKEDVDVQPYQMTLAVDANEINDDQIKVGVAKSDSHNWNDFFTESQPFVDQNGKVVIPIRFSQDITKFAQEPLQKIDRFVLKTKYGRWEHFATVILYNKLDKVISTDDYKLSPRDGRVIFGTALPIDYQDGDYKIGIINGGEYKIGLKLTNKTEYENLDIYGIANEYSDNTNLLPPISKAAPEVSQVVITNEFPERFDIIEMSYTYFDSNYEPEDKNDREIIWYINNTPIPYLSNLIKWNDVNNFKDPLYLNTDLTYPTNTELDGKTVEEWVKTQDNSILNPGDSIYAEIRVSDGELSSEKGKSDIVRVVVSPPIISSLELRGEDANGNITPRITSNTKVILYPLLQDSFYTDGTGENDSEIIWYVNSEIFKQGIYGEVSTGGIPFSEIWVNENGSAENKDYGLRINNSIYVQIIPKTGNVVGDTVLSDPIIVENSLPTVFDVKYSSDSHNENENIVLSWSYYDFEVDSLGTDDTSFQSNNSNVKAYRRKNELDQNFSLIYSSNDPDDPNKSSPPEYYDTYYEGHITTNIGLNTITVDYEVVEPLQQWYFAITPNDTIDSNVAINSSIITITPATN
jgi:hypothetical protein